MSVTIRGNIIKVREYKGNDTLGLHDFQITSIKDIKGLNKLVNLRNLLLGGNQLNEIEGLEGLKNLQRLYLQFNQIKNVKGLDNLVNLIQLDLGGNELDD